MAKQKGSGDDIWPESSQTFGYVRARKRHIVHMDGFIERTKAESSTGSGEPTKLGITNFSINFDALDKNLLVGMSIQLKPVKVEMVNNKQISKGPWLLVNLTGKETNLTDEQPAFQVYCHLFVQCQDGSKLQLLHKNDYSWKKPLELNITSIDMDIVKLEGLHELLLPEGRLTIVCELECAMYQSFDSTVDNKNTISTSQQVPESSENSLGQNLLTAFNDPEYSDVILEVVSTSASEKASKKNMVSTKQFHCHKVILATQSEVFAEMMNQKSTRAGNKKDLSAAATTTTTTIPIRDVDERTLQSLLTFIYTGSISPDLINDKLLGAAKHYQVERLLEICMKTLITDD